ncbi:MAG: ribosome-associated translation inhibitor RaiA [Syntrophomonadaceae bacterium]|nr:ribosome-associated translation inhibitor RaiA [Syntrophomonadaceae bacterium]
MNFEIRGRRMEVSEELKEYATRRLSKLEKYFDNVKGAQVLMSVEGARHTIEVTIPLNGIILRGEETTNDMYTAIDSVEEKLEKQIDKYKTKLYRHGRGAGLKRALADEIKSQIKAEPAEQENLEKFKIVRSKRFALKPMDEEEAIMQMNMLGHNFFVFFNANTDEVNVVYKRKNGDFGLIEPDFD